MKAASNLGFDHGAIQLKRLSHHCQQRYQLPALPCTARAVSCVSALDVRHYDGDSQHRHSPRLMTAKQRRPHTMIAATAPVVRAAAVVHPDILSVVYDEQQIAEAVSELGRQLAGNYADKQPLLLGTVDFFSASSYGAATVASGDVAVNMTAAKIDVTGRHVLVAEDIIDTGATLKRVVARLQEAGAASVKVVVLLNKAARRKVDIQPDYCALPCPDEFVVGYGLDFNEAYRSLPYVGVLRPELYT